jgi:hypothetical protein
MMIRLAATCLKTSARRTTGKDPDPMTSARTCPGPTNGTLVDVADDQQRRVVRYGLQQRLHEQDVDHRDLVGDKQSQSSGLPSFRLKLKPPVL